LALGSVDAAADAKTRRRVRPTREMPYSYAVRQSPKFHVSDSQPVKTAYSSISDMMVEQFFSGIRILGARRLSRKACRACSHAPRLRSRCNPYHSPPAGPARSWPLIVAFPVTEASVRRPFCAACWRRSRRYRSYPANPPPLHERRRIHRGLCQGAQACR